MFRGERHAFLLLHPCALGPWAGRTLRLESISDGERLEGACHRTNVDAVAAEHLTVRLLRRIDLHPKSVYPLGRRLFRWHREQVLACGAHDRELVRPRTLARPPCDARARLAQRNDARRLVLVRLVKAVKVDEANLVRVRLRLRLRVRVRVRVRVSPPPPARSGAGG